MGELSPREVHGGSGLLLRQGGRRGLGEELQDNAGFAGHGPGIPGDGKEEFGKGIKAGRGAATWANCLGDERRSEGLAFQV